VSGGATSLRNVRVAVIGAGLMGHGIAQVFARSGCPVALYDVGEDLLEQALRSIRGNLDTFVAEGLETDAGAEGTLSRIRPVLDLREAVRDADLVVEAAPEDPGLKKDLFTRLDAAAPERAILASNTSMLSISEFGGDCRKGDRLVITHWFNPPHIVPVVEVVAGDRTSDETMGRTVALLKAAGKEPVRVRREIPGFLVNRIQTAMFREVLSLLEQGVASAEDIDTAIKGSFGLRLGVVGVLETMDMAGLDLMLKGTAHLYRHIENREEPQRILEDKVSEGELGVKTGKGFYTYDGRTAHGDARNTVEARDRKLLRLLKALSS